jgi:hypothetical protein
LTLAAPGGWCHGVRAATPLTPNPSPPVKPGGEGDRSPAGSPLHAAPYAAYYS